MLVRDATPDDFDAITKIYKHAVDHFAATYETTAPDRAEMLKRFEGMKRRGLPYLAAENETRDVIGFAYANLFKERLAYRFMLEDSIYIAPEAQKGGVGSALLSALIARCEADGYRQLLAVIGDAERSLGSAAIHAKHGFVETGRFVGSGYKFGRWLDTLLMQRELNGGRNSEPDLDSKSGRLTL